MIETSKRNISLKFNIRKESCFSGRKVEQCFTTGCFNVLLMFRVMFRPKFFILLALLYFETLKHLILIETRNRGIRENREEIYSLIASKASISNKYIRG